MKITAIQAQLKRKGRYSVFVDEKYSFSLSEEAILEQVLRIGQELDQPDLKRLKQLSNDDKIYNASLRYIAMRPRSEWEITAYLERKGAEPALQQNILNKLTGYGYVNDENFARSFVRDRRLLRPTSLRKLQQELRLKHIADEVIKVVLGEDETDELTVIRQLIAKKQRQSRYQDRTKLMRYLAGQGFNYGDIKQALETNGND